MANKNNYTLFDKRCQKIKKPKGLGGPIGGWRDNVPEKISSGAGRKRGASLLIHVVDEAFPTKGFATDNMVCVSEGLLALSADVFVFFLIAHLLIPPSAGVPAVECAL